MDPILATLIEQDRQRDLAIAWLLGQLGDLCERLVDYDVQLTEARTQIARLRYGLAGSDN